MEDLTYKPATNIEELFHNLNPQLPIDDNLQDFYVKVFDKPIIEKLQKIIKLEKIPEQTYFVTGQTGSGKTSALLRIKRNLESEGFDGIHINVTDFDIEDVDAIDLLLITGFKIIQNNELAKEKLADKYFEDLEKIQDIKDETLEEVSETTRTTDVQAGAKAEAGTKINIINFVKLGFQVYSKLQVDKEFKHQVREKFVIKKDRLLNLINKIIAQYTALTKHKIILFIDDIEKLHDQDSINRLFINDLKLITRLNCTKIITYPPSIHDHIFYQGSRPPMFFSLRISNPPYDKDKEPDQEAIRGKKMLREILEKRIHKDYFDKLITDGAVEQAITKSGGNIKMFLIILYNATLEAILDEDNEKITVSHINEAVKQARQSISFMLQDSRMIEFLYDISKNHFPGKHDKQIFSKATQSNLIYFYYNDELWYEVNPIIIDTVKRYKESQ